MTFGAFAQRLAVRAELIQRTPNQPKQNENRWRNIYEKNRSTIGGCVRKERSRIPNIVSVSEYLGWSFDGWTTG
jgi:hypothetical protein